jgi:lysophospholipase L1-like esterase
MTIQRPSKPFDIVMIGSSIFEFWGLPKWGKLTISNQAVRSTTSDFWLSYDLSTLPVANNILVYCGSNDLIFGKNSQQIMLNLQRLLNNLAVEFPHAQIGYFSILECPQKQAVKQIPIIEKINSQMRNRFSSQYHYFYHYFEFNDAVRNQAKWFTQDGLHFTPEAYQMLDEFYRPIIEKWAGY